MLPPTTLAGSYPQPLADRRCRQISIETAQSKLDCSVLAKLPGKQILVDTIDLSDTRSGYVASGFSRIEQSA